MGTDSGLTPAKVALALACVATTALAGKLATLEPYGLWAAGAASGVLILVVLRLGITEAVIVLVPVMFYFPGAVNINLSAADFLLPPLALQALAAGGRVPRLAVFYGGTLIASMLLSDMMARLGLGAPAGSAGVIATAKVAICVVFFWVLSARLQPADRTRLISIWVAVASIISGATVLQFLGVAALGRSYGGTRAAGSFEDPNLFGVYLVLSLALAFSSNNAVRRPVRLLEVAIMLAAVTMTGSRTALIAIAVMAALALAMAGRRGGLRVTAGVTAVLGAAAVFSGQFSELALGSDDPLGRQLSIAQGASTDVRFELWGAAMSQWSDHPILGAGPGSFQGLGGLVAHSTYLTFMSEGGLLGLILFLFFPAVVAIGLFRRRHLGAHHRAVLVGLAGLMVEMAALNLQNVRFVWVFLALALWTAGDPQSPNQVETTKNRAKASA
jgi:O-antigen ligase